MRVLNSFQEMEVGQDAQSTMSVFNPEPVENTNNISALSTTYPNPNIHRGGAQSTTHVPSNTGATTPDDIAAIESVSKTALAPFVPETSGWFPNKRLDAVDSKMTEVVNAINGMDAKMNGMRQEMKTGFDEIRQGIAEVIQHEIAKLSSNPPPPPNS